MLCGVIVKEMLHKSDHRRGYIVAHATNREGTKHTIRGLVEEVENLGTKSRVKYLELTGIEDYYCDTAKQILGTIIDHDKIEWIETKE